MLIPALKLNENGIFLIFVTKNFMLKSIFTVLCNSSLYKSSFAISLCSNMGLDRTVWKFFYFFYILICPLVHIFKNICPKLQILIYFFYAKKKSGFSWRYSCANIVVEFNVKKRAWKWVVEPLKYIFINILKYFIYEVKISQQ